MSLVSTIDVSWFFYIIKVNVIDGKCVFKWSSTVGETFCVRQENTYTVLVIGIEDDHQVAVCS